MSDIISSLWNGLSPLADNCANNDAESKHLLHLMDRHRQKLYDSISKEDRKNLEKYIECSEEYLFHLSERAFCRGFSFAMQLFAEAVFGDN